MQNPADYARVGELVALRCPKLLALAPRAPGLEVTDGQTLLPSQEDDVDGDNAPDEIVFRVDLAPKERKVLWLTSLKEGEACYVPEKAVDAVATLVHPGYVGLESRLMAYGLQSLSPLAPPRGALQLQCYGKLDRTGLALCNMACGQAGLPPLLDVGKGFGLGGLAIGRTQPRTQETAVVWSRLIAAGPMRAGVEVRVNNWRTGRGGLYNARLLYFVYADREYVELRVELKVVKPSAEHFGVGMATLGPGARVMGGREDGFVGQWGVGVGGAGAVGLGIVALPWRIARIEGLGGEPCWLPGNGIVRLGPELNQAGVYKWRVFLVSDWQKGGRVNEASFGVRLANLAEDLSLPILVDDQPLWDVSSCADVGVEEK